VFARAMRRGGMHTVHAPVDVEAAADLLARMERGEEGQRHRLVRQSRNRHARTRANHDGAKT
jgi:hypothetical protein